MDTILRERRRAALRSLLGLLVAVGSAAAAFEASAVPMVLGETHLYATARLAGGSQDSQVHIGPVGGDGTLFQHAERGANSVTNRIRLDETGFHLEFEHVRGEEADGPILPAANTTLDVRFSVSERTTYRAEGFYSTIDPAGNRVWYQVMLRDRGTMQSLFWSEQDAQNTGPDIALELGGEGASGGPFSDSWYTGRMSGALVGELLVGVEYQLWVQAISSDMLNTPTPTTTLGTGRFSLLVAPEPSSGLLVTAGLLALAQRRRH